MQQLNAVLCSCWWFLVKIWILVLYFAVNKYTLQRRSVPFLFAVEFSFSKSARLNAVLSSCLVAGGSLPGVIPVTTKALWPQHQPTNSKYKNVYNCFVFISCPLSFILYHPAFWPQHLPTNIKYKMLTFWVESCCLLCKYQLAFWC